MATGQLVIPPDHLPDYLDELAIFLAGPIQGARDWQSDAIRFLQEKAPELHIASPRREVYIDSEEEYNIQVDWETHHLNRCAEFGVILFWHAKEHVHVCDRSYAQTTRMELGEWKERHMKQGVNLSIGIEDGYSGAKYIRRRTSQDCPDIVIQDSLEATCLDAIDKVYKL